MIHEIASEVYRMIREYGGLSRAQVAEAIGRKKQVVVHWETKAQKLLPKREYEEILVEKCGLSKLAFGHIMCEVLSDFLGLRFTVGPPEDYIPPSALMRAFRHYKRHRDDLEIEEQEAIESLISHARNLDVVAEANSRKWAQEITYRIDQALAEKGPPSTMSRATESSPAASPEGQNLLP